MVRILLAAVLLLAVTAAPMRAQSGDGGAVEIDAATYAELDERTGLLTLRGTPVVVRRGGMALRAPEMVYDTRQRVLRAFGGVLFQDPFLTLEAAEATVWTAEDRVVAAGGVAARQGGNADEIRLRALRLEIFGRERRVIASGGVEVASSDVTMAADRLEAALIRDELVAEGNARIGRADMEGRAPKILVRRNEGLAVLSGGAVVRQGASEAKAEVITIDLRRRRFTAAGRAILVLVPTR